MKVQKNKVVIIGAGNVGSAIMLTLLSSQSLAEIVIIDKNNQKAYGEALDASHSAAFAYSPNIEVKHGDYSECKDAGIIVMTAGPSAKPGEPTDRTALLKTNLLVMKEVMENIIQYTKEAIIIIVSNPVDVLTYYAQTAFGYPKEKIIGTGTLLDTARYRRILSHKYQIDAKNVHGYILGEHGATAFATWSTTNIAGIHVEQLDAYFPTSEPLDQEKILKEVVSVGWDILQAKGYTNFGIAKSVERLIQSILSNEPSILPVSTTLNGQYGIYDVSLSLPCIITSEGVGKVLEIPLNEKERLQLKDSAEFLKSVYANTQMSV